MDLASEYAGARIRNVEFRFSPFGGDDEGIRKIRRSSPFSTASAISLFTPPPDEYGGIEYDGLPVKSLHIASDESALLTVPTADTSHRFRLPSKAFRWASDEMTVREDAQSTCVIASRIKSPIFAV